MSWLSSLLFRDSLGITGGSFVKPQPIRDHPLNTSAFFMGKGSKICQIWQRMLVKNKLEYIQALQA